MKETITNNEQTHTQELGEIFHSFLKINKFFSLEIRLRLITEEYEQKLKEQEAQYSADLKSITKEMNSQIEEKEQQFNQQLQELISKLFKKLFFTL
jgi:ABC-type Zn2+ transport system substrate-binding protein/surface adhesin